MSARRESPADEAPRPRDGGEETGGARSERWAFLIDPAWRPHEEGATPPAEAIVGGWFVTADDRQGRFRPNPAYQPSSPDSPTDPADAAVRLVAGGDASGDDVLTALRQVVLGVAVDEDGDAIVIPSPDDVPSIVVTTAPLHRRTVRVPGWRDALLPEVAAALSESGVDLLVNPGSAASIRLLASAVVESLAEAEDDDFADDPFGPSFPVPADPVDLALHELLDERATPERLQVALRGAVVDLALDDDDRALLVTTSDDDACVMVATTQEQRDRVKVENWARVGLAGLVDALPDDAAVLFNPAGGASVRVPGDFVRAALAMTDEEAFAVVSASEAGRPVQD
ncbi:type VII secretion system-associated protein [Umezawaea beigongshangensis]|uniref:type VII secretion system-associated protein n=1 Tax=Umezawaea beigongshangensis TaxID=2780383 RepID=UPI0018F13B0B|nr:type VII secretion system-associated protein [Umezawaea beigongshangensis]